MKTEEPMLANILEQNERVKELKKCFKCKSPQQIMVKVIVKTTPFGEVNQQRTKNYMGVCTNPTCFRFPAHPLESWEPVSINEVKI